MSVVFMYLLKASGAMIVFALAYFIFLKKLTFYRWNRIYIWSVLILSLVIPLLPLPSVVELHWIRKGYGLMNTQDYMYKAYDTSFHQRQDKVQHSLTALNFITMIYFAGIFISVIALIKNIRWIKRLSKNTSTSANKNVEVTYTEDINGSFFKSIFIQRGLSPQDEEVVLLHEKTHGALGHHADLTAMELLRIFFWFNPAVYFFRHWLREMHESEVDEVVASKVSTQRYAEVLVKLASSQPSVALLNSYGTHAVVGRIHHLFNPKTPNMKKMMYILMLPFLFVAVAAFAQVRNNDNDSDIAGKQLITLKDGCKFLDDPKNLVLEFKLQRLLGKGNTWKTFEAFERTNLPAVQDIFEREGYDLTIQEKKMNAEGGLSYFKIVIRNPAGSIAQEMPVDTLLKSGDCVLMIIDKKKNDMMTMTAADIIWPE